jgi:hypothetical protein
MAADGPEHISNGIINGLVTHWERERPWRTPPDLQR